MAFAFVDSTSNYTASGTSVDAAHSFATGTLLIGVYAFQGVTPVSGPWGDPNLGQYGTDHVGPSTGWQRVAWQAPSGSGVGIEIWAAINSTTSAGGRILAFTGTYQCQVVMGAWTGAYAPTGSILDGAVRVATTAAVTGNAPAAPAVSVNAGELIVAVAGDLMTASKFGTPAGYASRIDVAGGGAGNVEATIADLTATVAGATGKIVFPNNAASSTTLGATGTLAIRPVPAVGGVGGVLEAAMPPGLVIGDGWTLRFTAIDPQTGVLVPGVNVSLANVVADDLSGGGGAGGDLGPFMLVPGPEA